MQRKHIFIGIATNNLQDGAQLAKVFTKAGFETIDLTLDEVAKSHLRHMVGGHSVLAENELLYRFEFPEETRSFDEVS
jgi:threonine dehydratase